MVRNKAFSWEKVVFRKPDFSEITREFMCFDMHVHSLYSDSHTRISSIIKKSQRLGIGIGLTDHNSIKGAIELSKRFDKTIPGIEVTLYEGTHMLVYFYTPSDLRSFYERCIEKNKGRSPYLRTKVTMEKLLEYAKKFNGLIGPAHPFFPSISGFWKNLDRGLYNEDLVGRFDFIEVFNGQNIQNWNLKSIKLACETQKPMIGGSDSHVLFEVGDVVTCAKADSTDSFLKAVLKNKTIIYGKAITMPKRLVPHILTFKRHSRYLTPYIFSKMSGLITKRLRKYNPKIN